MRPITLCALLAPLGAWAQTSFQSVVVHSSDGQIHTYGLSVVDSITFSTEVSVQHCKWYHSLENPGIADYLRDFEYDPEDYSYHRLFDYRGEPYLDARQDWPYGVTLGDTTYYNLIPGRSYTLAPVFDHQEAEPITIQTLGQLRQIRAEGIDNVRDLGGWPTADGRRLRYGLLYRGTELNTLYKPTYPKLRSPHQVTEADVRMMRDLLGIRAELDLREASERPEPDGSPLGEDIAYISYPISFRDINTSYTNRTYYLGCLRFIIGQLQQGHPVYIHCIWGADRTGILCCLLEGALGVSQSDLDKDYELTSFGGNTRYRNNEYYLKVLHHIRSLDAPTLQQQFRARWIGIGATAEELDLFTSLMCL